MSGKNSPVEVELKLRLAKDEVPRLMRHHLLHPLKGAGLPKAKRLVSVYYDTANFDLHNNKAALRVRNEGKKKILSVERAPSGNPKARSEWEEEVVGDRPNLRRVADPVIRQVFAEMKRRRPLKPQFITDVRRREWPIQFGDTELRVALDLGEITSPRGSVPVCEAEIELISGDAARIYEVARRLHRSVSFTVEAQSKVARGYALAGNLSPSPQKAARVVLRRRMTVAEAFVEIGRNCLIQIRANEACASLGEDPEGVHQLRVGLRRMRAVLVALRHHSNDGKRQAINTDLRWISRECGHARSWDVFIALARRFEGEPGFADLMNEAEGERAVAYSRMRAVIASRRHTEIMLKLDAMWDGGGWTQLVDSARLRDLDEPIRDFARRTLKHLNKKLHKFGDGLRTLSPKDLHHLRIRAKRLRYVGEFFRSLFPPKLGSAYLSALEGVQDRLGTLNDANCMCELMGHLDRQPGKDIGSEKTRIASVILDRSVAQLATERARLPRAWTKFEGERPFWK